MMCLVTELTNVTSYGQDTSSRSMELLDHNMTVMEQCDVNVITTHQTHTPSHHPSLIDRPINTNGISHPQHYLETIVTII